MKVLQFSGGLDSLACLELLKGTPGLIVATASTDGVYPERLEYLAQVAAAHPHLTFREIKTDRQLKTFGQPVDVVPIRFTMVGHAISDAPVKYQSFAECCDRGLWSPMANLMKQLGATTVYRGQRLEDHLKSPVRDGFTSDGIVYKFPLENWTRQEVKDFVQMHCPELIPAYYKTERTSRDCWDCTAYLEENLHRIRNLPQKQWKHVTGILNEWRDDVNKETRW